MRPSLANILDATLETLAIERWEWDMNHKSRQSAMVKAKELFCLLAFDEGYLHKEIGQFIGQHRTTAIHHINMFRAHCDIYPKCYELIERARSLIVRNNGEVQRSSYSSGWLARSHTGLLTISPNKPERMAGYWMAEGTKPFVPQTAFPQITYESGPAKVTIKVTIDEEV